VRPASGVAAANAQGAALRSRLLLDPPRQSGAVAPSEHPQCRV